MTSAPLPQTVERPRRPAIPRPLTSFVGREEEIALVQRLLIDQGVRLVTLTGPSGVGKTRVALRAAELMIPHFPEGLWFVSLAQLTDPNLVWPTVAKAVGVGDLGSRPVIEQIAAHIGSRRALLVIDNMEHMVAMATGIGELLSRCHSLRVLATSQALLRLSGEHDVTIGPLPLPGERTRTIDQLLSIEAGRLFIDRARAVRQDVGLTDDQAANIAAIVRRLEGLPLAIELAASRAKVLSPQALLSRLDNSLLFLAGGAVDQPERLRTMRAAIAWSHDLLADDERAVFRRLSVFRGGFTLSAAEAVAGGNEQLPAFDIVVSLVEKSLLRYDESPDDEQRFYMLLAIREFAYEQLTGAGEVALARNAHHAWYTELAEQAERELVGPGQDLWLKRLEAEQDNFRAALSWAIEQQDITATLRLGAALWRYWAVHGDLQEGRTWLEQGLALPGEVDPATLSKAHHHLGNLAVDLGDFEAARTHYEAGHALRCDNGTPATVAESLNGLGLVALFLGNYDDARRLHEQSLALRMQIDDKPGIGNSYSNLGDVALAVGDLQLARELHEKALASRRQIGHQSGIAYSLYNLGVVGTREGRFDEAQAQLDEAMAIFQQLGERLGIGEVQHQLAQVARGRGDNQRAASLLGEVLTLRRVVADSRGLIESMEAVAELASDFGLHRDAARLIAAVDAHRIRLQMARSPAAQESRQQFNDALRSAIDAGEMAGLEDQGAHLPFADAVNEAIRIADLLEQEMPAATAELNAPPADDDSLLTPREREVLRLVIAGMTDQGIADTLFISRRTVTTHVQNIRGKLGVQNRAEAVARAIRDKLV